MLKYNADNKENLRIALRKSYVHDAVIDYVTYSCSKKNATIRIYNPIFNKQIVFTFCNIKTLLVTGEQHYGSNSSVISLTLEDDNSYLQKHLRGSELETEGMLYILFQMFSGQEIHIVVKEVIIEDTDK